MTDYQSYLHRRHAAFRTPQEVIFRMGYLAHHLQIPGYPESALVTPGLRHTLHWLLGRGW
jgi:hypothetical protein